MEKLHILLLTITSIMSSGNRKMEHPSFRATLMIYVEFNFLSSSAICPTDIDLNVSIVACKITYSHHINVKLNV